MMIAQDLKTKEKDNTDINSIPNSNNDTRLFMTNFIHAIQFCHLCHKGKISPVFYSLSTSPEIKTWFKDLENSNKLGVKSNQKRSKTTMQSPETDEDLSSPESKISRKDKHFLNAMLKIPETLYKTMMHSALDRNEKEPGFARLEHHKKIMILNPSAIPPFDDPAPSPTDFYSSFLSNKSQLKAKDMLSHRYLVDKVSFNPSASFVNCLWNGDFLWILPDSPSGISIFYCPESKSRNAHELEKERALALADKIKQGDIKKLTTQKLYIIQL
jgi:hypothetical protein